MSANHPIDRYILRYPYLSALIYVALVVALTLAALFAVLDIAERHRAVSASAEVLARLERRAPSFVSASAWNSDLVPAGSPFLEGQTVTLASAALLQQITAAITGVGGRVISSEVAPRGERSGEGFVRVVANCDLEEGALQHLLYDIEAGMPFLFIDQFVVEAPANEGGRMHVVLGVSGLWLGAK
jgi:general secretion pathway protein M